MIPLKDNIPAPTTPVVNYLMIIACAVVFVLQLLESHRQVDPEMQGRSFLVEQYGMIPLRVLHPDEPIRGKEVVPHRGWLGEVQFAEREFIAKSPPFTPWLTLLTCIFLHGGWMHLIGNMWFLFIFGDNVEDRFGHLGYLLFYLLGGIAASAVHLWTNTDSTVPTIGASGAIAGVMGAYFVLYPRARVLTLIPLFFYMQIIVLPAGFFLGFWFLLQFFQGTLASASAAAGGVAWWAHIGGFVAGVVVALVCRATGLLRPSVAPVLPNAGNITNYRYRPW